VLVAALAYVAWGQLFAGVTASRALWGWLDGRLAERPGQGLQAALFAVPPDRHHEWLVFGVGPFVEAVRRAVGEERSAGVVLATDRLDAVVDFVECAEGLSYGRALLQNRPYFWSNLDPTSPSEDTVLWRAAGLGLASRRGGAADFWHELEIWAQGPGTRAARREWAPVRGGSLAGVHVGFPPPMHRAAWNRLRRLPEATRARLVWVADTTRLPPDTPPDLVPDFLAALDDPEALGWLGRHVRLEALLAAGAP